MEITSNSGKKHINILINGIPHVCIKKDVVIGFNTWERHGWFYIEINTTTGPIELEYNMIEKWKEIISLLHEKIAE